MTKLLQVSGSGSATSEKHRIDGKVWFADASKHCWYWSWTPFVTLVSFVALQARSQAWSCERWLWWSSCCIEIDATLPDVCMQFNFESSVLDWMSWSASGAAAETWNCTVNQETAREEETSVQHEFPIAYLYHLVSISYRCYHGTSQLKHFWILALLLTDAITH